MKKLQMRVILRMRRLIGSESFNDPLFRQTFLCHPTTKEGSVTFCDIVPNFFYNPLFSLLRSF
jgi:hypothetical protein